MKWWVFCLAVSAACGPRGKVPHDTPPPPDMLVGEDGPLVTSVHDLRATPHADGTIVQLAGVVVTSHVTSTKYGRIWVQDPGGGVYSGIEVFCNFGGTMPDCSLTRTQLDAFAVGSVVNVTGKLAAYLPASAPAGAAPVLELAAPTISSTGATTPPVAVDVDVSFVAKANLAAGGSADPYKGAYVHLIGATTFTTTSITAAEFSATCTDRSSPPRTGATYFGFEATGAGQTLALGLGFYDTLTYCLPCTGVPLPYPCTNPITASQTFHSIKGIVEPDYNANGMAYLALSPVVDADLI
jgi:hypothetical protein